MELVWLGEESGFGTQRYLQSSPLKSVYSRAYMYIPQSSHASADSKKKCVANGSPAIHTKLYGSKEETGEHTCCRLDSQCSGDREEDIQCGGLSAAVLDRV